jgi:hypothetical protein
MHSAYLQSMYIDGVIIALQKASINDMHLSSEQNLHKSIINMLNQSLYHQKCNFYLCTPKRDGLGKTQLVSLLCH